VKRWVTEEGVVAMGLYTGVVKGLSRAPYRVQVLTHLIGFVEERDLTADEEAKIERVARFLSAQDCAREIIRKRGLGLHSMK
jgi:hypothetical protein